MKASDGKRDAHSGRDCRQWLMASFLILWKILCKSRREDDLRAVILAVNTQRGRNGDSIMAVVQMMWTMYAEICGKVASRWGEGDGQVACCL